MYAPILSVSSCNLMRGTTGVHGNRVKDDPSVQYLLGCPYGVQLYTVGI